MAQVLTSFIDTLHLRPSLVQTLGYTNRDVYPELDKLLLGKLWPGYSALQPHLQFFGYGALLGPERQH